MKCGHHGNDVKVAGEDRYLSHNMTIKANLTRIGHTRVIQTQPLETDTDAQLHKERVITVREEFETARTNVQEVRLVSRLASTEELAGIDVLCSNKTGTPTQNIMTIASKLPWCETSEQGLLFALLATQW